ncbi:ABC transporter permease [Jiangella alba]|uniref:Peptide/nickel transport system permease protein n=1 Tax=Jiangella alba TaxID=561176 RepID=A0A1H5Q158_9ACTN|nr:ABC transporter permease [Jiangella alba]SEF18967.1 peptide/nickel transport system permease protein [Jiangella alba]
MTATVSADPQPGPSGPAPVVRRGRRLRDHTTALGAIGGVIVLTLVTIAVLAPVLAPYDPAERAGTPFSPPSPDHLLGTNDVGQDLLSEMIYGTRVSLTVGIVAAAAAMLIGTVVGLIGGYFPRLGAVAMRGVDVVLILPFLPLLIVLAAYMGRSIVNTVIIIAILIWAPTARVIRSQVLSLAGRDYIVAARSMGAGHAYVLWRHVLPKTMLLAIGEFVAATSGAILLESSLSFLGLGDPLQESWGSTLYWAQARGAFLTPAWKWWVLPPGLLIMCSALGFALLGYALEQRINPRLRRS